MNTHNLLAIAGTVVLWADGGDTLRCATDESGAEQCSISGYALKRVAN
jgi:hypothetical protein